MKAPLTLLVLLTLSAPAVAHASVSYPGELMKHWELEALPGAPPYCTLCHGSDAGGTGTATTPFGRALLKSGTLGGNVPSLDSALDVLEASGNDSDRDGATDLEELSAKMDPNEGEAPPGSAPDPLADVPLPRTGCGVGALHHPPDAKAAWSLALLLLALRRARRTAG